MIIDEHAQIGKCNFKSPIAVVPSQGYTRRDNYIKISIQWLEWLMDKSLEKGDPMVFSHALNGGEYQITGTNNRCDGFVKSPNGKGTINEFYGKSLYLILNATFTPLSPLNRGGGGGGGVSELTNTFRFFF